MMLTNRQMMNYILNIIQNDYRVTVQHVLSQRAELKDDECLFLFNKHCQGLEF